MPHGALNEELEVFVSGGGLGAAFPSVTIAARRDFPFAVNFQPAAGFPFRGWQMARDGEAVAGWRPDGDGAVAWNAPGWEALWEPRNASGTEMEMTIRELPGGGAAITIMPYGGQSEELEIFVSGGGLGTPFPFGTTTARQGFSFAVNFEPAAGFPFRGWQMIRGGALAARTWA